MQRTFKARIAPYEFITATVEAYDVFSVTGEVSCRGSIYACGYLHKEISQHFPQLDPIIALHLCDLNGVPMRAFEDACFWMGLTKRKIWQGNHPDNPPNAQKLAKHLRISKEQAVAIINSAQNDSYREDELAYAIETVYKPRWKREAESALLLLRTLPDTAG